MVGGILFGVGAAFFQDCGYVVSRDFIKKGGSSLQLLIATQLVMGGISLLLLPLFWTAGAWGGWAAVLPLCGAAFGSLGGQLFFFRAERNISPARLASLMGLRVVMLAIFSALLFSDRYSMPQLGGIALAALSALVMNYERGRLKWAGMGALGCALLCYVASDLSVRPLVRSFHTDDIFHSSLLAMLAVNGLLFVSCLPFFFRLERSGVAAGGTFSAFWLCKQFLLYSCYAVIGPVFGNVVLASRGPIALGMALVRLRRKPEPVDWRLWWQRGAATFLMFGAIALYLLG